MYVCIYIYTYVYRGAQPVLFLSTWSSFYSKNSKRKIGQYVHIYT